LRIGGKQHDYDLSIALVLSQSAGKMAFEGGSKPDLLPASFMKREPSPQIAARQIGELSRLRPRLAIVLGSGFQGAIARMKVDAEIGFEKLPGFPSVGVDGHAGRMALGYLGGASVAILSGRAHYYEGHPMERVTFPVRALAAFGIADLLLTNAAGGLNSHFLPGDFMVVTDHINFMGANPLRGPARPNLHRFVDLTKTYDAGLTRLLRQAGRVRKLKLRSGVYLAVAGPSYETPAEIRAFARLGADAVGMSTVPEAIVGRQCGLKVAALSCITNLAAGRGTGGEPLSHTEVLRTAGRVRDSAALLLECFAELYGKSR
jgi:purine-nucleoside phosphorylase